MPDISRDYEQKIRDRAYYIWEREGRPDGRAWDHWIRALRERFHPEPSNDDDSMWEEEKLLAGRLDVNMPALLTRDVKGG